MYKGKFDQKEHSDAPKAAPKEERTSFADLDLGLDFDLSFLDDIDETVLETPKPAKRPAAEKPPVKKADAPKTAPAKKAPTPAKASADAPKAAPTKKPASQASAAGKPAASAPKAAPQKKPAAPGEKPAAAKSPAQKKPAAPPQEPVKKKKKGPRLGGVIFYTLYFMFILVFFLATFLGLTWLKGWLVNYEQSQPTVKAQMVFDQLFTNPDWGALYDAAGAKDSSFEGKDAYVTYMKNKVGGTVLNYMETSAGLSGDKKYLIRLGDEKIASFTLVDQNHVDDSSLDDLESIAAISDWKLDSVEIFFTREGYYRIEKVDNHTAYVNGVPLDDSYTIQIATTKAESYLPEGTTGASMCTQEVRGLMALPTVTVTDKNGAQKEVTYDEATRTFTERTESNTMAPEQEEAALNAAKTYGLWMIEEITDRGKLAKSFDTASTPYKTITTLGKLWMQGHAGYEFSNESVSKFASYGENLFSVNVSLDLNVTRKDGTVKNYEFDQNLFFENKNGKWLCIEMTNEDIYQPVGKVRLTFMDGQTQLTSDFYTTDAKQIITPIIPTPDGKVFSGWVRQDVDAEGTTTLTVVFQPDETGRVQIPDGTNLTPMTLYALFEDAGSVSEVPATTPPTEGA